MALMRSLATVSLMVTSPLAGSVRISHCLISFDSEMRLTIPSRLTRSEIPAVSDPREHAVQSLTPGVRTPPVAMLFSSAASREKSPFNAWSTAAAAAVSSSAG